VKLPKPRRSTRSFELSASAMDQRAASSTFSTSAVSRPVFTDTASTNCCLVICSSVPAIAPYRFTTVTSGLGSCCDNRSCGRESLDRPSPRPGKLPLGLLRAAGDQQEVCHRERDGVYRANRLISSCSPPAPSAYAMDPTGQSRTPPTERIPGGRDLTDVLYQSD
jgi:hypothetical protein